MSGAIQEFVEALSMTYFLETGRIISLSQARAKVPDYITISCEDFILGLLDLTGELMKYSLVHLTAVSSNNRSLKPLGQPSLATVSDIATQIQTTLINLKLQLEFLKGTGQLSRIRGLDSKFKEMNHSIEKVENSICSFLIRESEVIPYIHKDEQS